MSRDPKQLKLCTCMNPKSAGSKRSKCGYYKSVPKWVCNNCEGPGWLWTTCGQKKDCTYCSGTGFAPSVESMWTRAHEILEIYSIILTETLPENPSYIDQLCALDNALMYLERAQVKSKKRRPCVST